VIELATPPIKYRLRRPAAHTTAGGNRAGTLPPAPAPISATLPPAPLLPPAAPLPVASWCLQLTPPNVSTKERVVVAAERGPHGGDQDALFW